MASKGSSFLSRMFILITLCEQLKLHELLKLSKEITDYYVFNYS